MPGRRPLALCLAALLLLGGCGVSAHSALSVAQSWAAAQRAGQASRACDLSATDSVRMLGGRAGCVRFFAAFSLGRNVRVDPSGVTPRRPNVYAIVDSEPGVTRYGMSVRVVTEAGVQRVHFDPPAGISVCVQGAATRRVEEDRTPSCGVPSGRGSSTGSSPLRRGAKAGEERDQREPVSAGAARAFDEQPQLSAVL